jgi:hypothetical protein
VHWVQKFRDKRFVWKDKLIWKVIANSILYGICNVRFKTNNGSSFGLVVTSSSVLRCHVSHWTKLDKVKMFDVLALTKKPLSTFKRNVVNLVWEP